MIEFGTLAKSLDTVWAALTIADVSDPEQPLIYANRSFWAMTGYGQEVLGTNCRFLQTDEDQQPERAEIRNAIVEGRRTQVILSNRRANEEEFQNLLLLMPLKKYDGFPEMVLGAQFDLGPVFERTETSPVNTLQAGGLPTLHRTLALRVEQRSVAATTAARMAEAWLTAQSTARLNTR